MSSDGPIPVIWHSATDVPTRGSYWDMHWLELMVSGELWKPAYAYSFTHFHSFEEYAGSTDRGEGAVVVVPARHTATDAAVNDLADYIRSHLDWCLLVLCGDEEGVFPVEAMPTLVLRHNPTINIRIWVQTPRPSLILKDIPIVRYVGDMFPPFTREYMSDHPDPFSRPIDVSFIGQVNNQDRVACVNALRKWEQDNPHRHVVCIPTSGFTQGLPRDQYLETLIQSKIVLCPSGTYTVDTFRLFEAMEAGCLTLASAYSPMDPEPVLHKSNWDYWDEISAYPYVPIRDWNRQLGDELDRLLDMPDDRFVGAMEQSSWIMGKRDLARRFHSDISELRGGYGPNHRHEGGIVLHSRPAPKPRDRITVVVVTSPARINSSDPLIHIREVVESVRAHDDLKDAEIIISADGIHSSQAQMTDSYYKYLRHLAWACSHHWHNVALICHGTHLHQNGMMDRLLNHDPNVDGPGWIDTPYLLFMEHDTPLLPDINWQGCLDFLDSGEAEVIRFHHEASVLDPHRHLMLDPYPIQRYGVKAMRTVQWSQRPHLARVGFYRSILSTYFTPQARTMIEDVMYGVVHQGGPPDWHKWKLWLYAETNDLHGMKRSGHLDSRGTDAKVPMVWRYPGGVTPPGAPAPYRDEDREETV